jgi:hypothetical protein
MAKERGTLAQCLATTRHHVDRQKVYLMDAAGALTVKDVGYRFKLVDDNLKAAEQKLVEVANAAKRGDLKAVLKALSDPIEFGHDIVI